MKPVKVNTRPVAARYAACGERIIEYSADGIGGLISFTRTKDGGIHVRFYRHDAGVTVTVDNNG